VGEPLQRPRQLHRRRSGGGGGAVRGYGLCHRAQLWGTTGSDYATIAYNAATGATQWAKRYNGPGNGGDAASSLALGPGGATVYVTGYSYAGAATGYDYATIAYNAATGAQAWVRRYNGPANSTDAAYSVAASPVTGAVFVTGISYGANGNGDYLTVAYSG
jgi:hypothetical protein